MSNQKDTVNNKYFYRMFYQCVIVPLLLSVGAIISTCLPTQIQSQIIAGLPMVLWIWFVIVALICLTMLYTTLSLLKSIDK